MCLRCGICKKKKTNIEILLIAMFAFLFFNKNLYRFGNVKKLISRIAQIYFSFLKITISSRISLNHNHFLANRHPLHLAISFNCFKAPRIKKQMQSECHYPHSAQFGAISKTLLQTVVHPNSPISPCERPGVSSYYYDEIGARLISPLHSTGME